MNQFINKIRNVLLLMLAVFLIATLPIVVVSAFIAMLTPIEFLDITSHGLFWTFWILSMAISVVYVTSELQSYLD